MSALYGDFCNDEAFYEVLAALVIFKAVLFPYEVPVKPKPVCPPPRGEGIFVICRIVLCFWANPARRRKLVRRSHPPARPDLAAFGRFLRRVYLLMPSEPRRMGRGGLREVWTGGWVGAGKQPHSPRRGSAQSYGRTATQQKWSEPHPYLIPPPSPSHEPSSPPSK